MLFAEASTKSLPLDPASSPSAYELALGLTMFGLFALSLVVFVRMYAQVSRQGVKTRPDLFALTDVVAVIIIVGFFYGISAVLHAIEWVSPARASAGPPDQLPPSPDAIQIINLTGFLTVPAILIGVTILMRGGSVVTMFGLNRMPVHRAIGLGLGLAFLAFSIVGVIGLVISHFVHFDEKQMLVKTFETAAQQQNLPLLSAIATSAIAVAPCCEEIVFRGSLYPVLTRYVGRLPAALATAVFFGLVHDTKVAFPGLACLSLVLTLTYEFTGTLLAPIALHATFNAINLVLSWSAAQGGSP